MVPIEIENIKLKIGRAHVRANSIGYVDNPVVIIDADAMRDLVRQGEQHPAFVAAEIKDGFSRKVEWY